VQYRVHDANTTFSSIRKQWAVNMEIKAAIAADPTWPVPARHRLAVALLDAAIRHLPRRGIDWLMQLRGQLKA
jgi:hypothetical protein